jgi:hypothetical protein
MLRKHQKTLRHDKTRGTLMRTSAVLSDGLRFACPHDFPAGVQQKDVGEERGDLLWSFFERVSIVALALFIIAAIWISLQRLAAN